MPGPGDPAILPRSDLTLHHAPPATPGRPHTVTCPPLEEEVRGWVNTLGRSKALNDGTCWAEDSSPTMSQRERTTPRSRDTWHGFSPDCRFGSTKSTDSRFGHTRVPNTRFSSTRSQDSRFRSSRSQDFRFSSTRSHDERNYSIRSRTSLHSSLRSRSSLRSVASRASSTLHRSLRRTGPLYRVASSRARAAREWAGTLSQRVTGRGGTLLLTPARGRRQPVVVATCGSPTPGPARNSPRVQATRRAASAARTIHWEVASGLAALFECGATAGSAAAAGVGRVCTAAAAMADGKLQQVRRSISSWSLSTVKKPKITVPKLKAPKIKIFRGGKKNRVDPKDEAAALEEVKAALLKAEGDGGSQSGGAASGETGSEVIHEPSAGIPQEGQPTIVLTVHEHKNPPEPPSPPPSPGLLAVKDDLEFIDSDEADTDAGVIEAVHPELDYSDQWFDACGTLTRSKENVAEAFNDFDDGQESRYYDFVDNTVPKQEEPGTPPKEKAKGGSQKAREWVKSFDEKAESRIQKWLKMNKLKTSSNLPKSKSEVRLDDLSDPPDKWSKRDEIKLNTMSRDASQAGFLHDRDMKVEEKEQKRESEKEKSTRKESIKKIFQVRGKLSIKPIVDSQRTTYKDTDIHIAAAPYALATTAGASETTKSLDVSQEDINCTADSIHLDGSTVTSHQQDETSSAPSQPSSVEKHDISEATQKTEASGILDMDKYSQNVNDKQPVKKDVVKEATQNEKGPPPQSQEVPLDISTANAISNATETQVRSKKGDNDYNVSSLSQSQDVSVANCLTNIASTDAASQGKLTKEINDPGLKRENPPGTDSKDVDNDTQMKDDLQKPGTETITNSCSLPKETMEPGKPGEGREQPSVTQRPKEEAAAAESSKAETKDAKKNKISGTSFPKSIKNFAGSVFSHQTGLKGKGEAKEEDSADKKKKKGKMSPFIKDNLFKVSIKDKFEAVKERGKTPPDVKEMQVDNKTEDEKLPSEKNLNPFEDDEGNPLADEAPNFAESSESSTGAEKESEAPFEDLTPSKTTQEHPQTSSSNGIPPPNRSPSASPVSLEFVSQADSDEMKTVSHESSPGIDTSFVVEDGLRLRKDALLAIKAMEVDDTTTNYYSFRSASEEFQTPMVEDKDLQDTASVKTLPKVSAVISDSEVQPEVAMAQEVHNDADETRDNRMELPPPVTESPSAKGGSDTNTLKINKTNVDEENLQSTADELNNKNMEEINSQPVVNGPSSTPIEVTPQHDAPQHKGVASQPQNRTHSEEIPQLRLNPSSYTESQDPPKPSPRTKKGRYGYSTVAGCVAPPGTQQGTTPSTREASVGDNSVNGQSNSPIKSADNNMMATYPGRALASKKDAANELRRTPSDSGYAGPGTYYSSGSDVEPIYWEISEPRDAPPKPSPRTKKNQKPQYEAKPNQSKVVRQPSPNPVAKEESHTKPLPEWINTRAPIPSPRGKKQHSLQSLSSVVPADDTMESVKKKLQMLSHEPIPDVTLPQQMPIMTKKEEEQFYSGKAASISYGFTPARVPPPSPPLRVRKASQMSLPAAMAAEEAQTRQQKRRSLYVSPDGEAVPQPPSPRRARRRTDHTQDAKLRNIESAVKRLGEQVVCLTDLLAAVGLQEEATRQKTEELLTDVLYSVHSLMGGTAAGVWKVGGEGDYGGPSSRGEVHMEQVVRMLQSAFQVTQETTDRLQADVQSRPPPEVSLQLSIKEARDLRPKTVKGTTNPYVIVSVPSSSASHRTRLEKDTLWPKWNQEFTLPISNFQKEYLRLEVWHEHDAVKVRHALTAVRDIKGMSRLVRGTTAQVQHQTSHLLGQVVVSVKDLSERGADGWFTLEKNEERSKERGSIHLAGTVTSKAQLENKSRQSYDALLARLIHHQLTATNNNNEHSEWSRPWNGHLSGPGAASLAQYAIMLDLSDAAIQLAWWKVGSRVSTADAEWVLSRLRVVQTAMSKNLYQDEELLELRSSFTSFVRDHTERLKDLHKAFPPSSGVIARRQLSFTLKALQCMQNHAGTRALLDLEGLPHLHEIVTSSLATHAKNWWTAVIDELRDVRTTDEQISHVINILKESHTFLSIAANTYNAIFTKEMNIPYMQTTYLMVSKKVNPCVRPLVMNIYNRLPALGNQEEGEMEECEYRLEVGTSLWELYMNLGRLHQLGESLSAEARAESGVREYHRWFSRGVLRWLELALCRARSMIKKAVELDMLEPQDDYCKFSSSATDTLGIFHDIKIWWQKLAWPDPENSAVVLTKILEDICSCVISYSNLIREKVERIFHEQENITRAFITEQICVGLNNIERVRTEMVNLPTQFGFQDLLQKIRAAGSGDSAAAQLDATVDRLIVNAAENMEAKVTEFIDTVLEKMHPTLERAVNEACEAQSGRPLLAHVLDPSLKLTLDRLNTSNFKRFLWRVWEVVVEIFNATVMKNTERRKAIYFGGVHSILGATLNYFSPPDGTGLDENTAMTPAYTSLMELLESLRMSSESLIAQYYQERYDEQMEEILPCKARLYVKALFTKPGKLIVEVIMAKDMVVESDAASITSRGGGLGSTAHQPVDSYVKVQLVPQEWFPAAAIRKTKTQRKQDPAVYEETFEYDLSKTDDGVRAGFLLLTLKDYNLGFTNTFIGEAVVPLSSLKCVDSSEVHTVQNTCLTMTSPGLDIGYKSLRALQFRTGDKVASSFIKKVSKRLIEPKAKASTPLRPDEDKARSKSPNMRERLKLS